MEINGKIYRNLEGQVGYLTGKYGDLQDQINDLKGKLTHYIIVEELPVENIDTSAVYLVGPKGTAPDQYYEEWVYVQKADESWMWEKLGDTASVDLSGYLQKDTSTTPYAKAYIKKADGSQDTVSMTSSDPTQGFVAQWGSGGRMATKDPVNSSDAVNLSYANSNYVAKRTDVTTNYYAYCKASDGSQTTLECTGGGGAGKLALYVGSGNLNVGTPTADTQATPKKYVEDNFVAKQTGTTSFRQAYAKGTDGSQYMQVINGKDMDAGVDRIAAYGTDGRLRVGEPVNAKDAATKGYVDAAIGQLIYTHTITLSFTVNTRSFILNITLLNDDSTAYTSTSGTQLLGYLQGGVYSIITNSYANASYWSVAVCPSDKYHHSDTGIGFYLTAGTDGSTIYVDGIDPNYNSAISNVSVTDVVTTW